MSDRQVMIRRWAAVLIATGLICMAAVAAAQTPFALSSVGQRLDADDARMVGRGYWGMAVSDSVNPGFKNIASLSSLKYVALKFTGQGERTESSDADYARQTYRTYAPDIRVALPVVKGHLAFTAGFRVDRSMEWTTTENKDWSAWGDDITGNEQFKRAGTKFEVPLGLAFAPVHGLSFGATMGLTNGSVTETLSQFFVQPTAGGLPLYSVNVRQQVDELDGTSWTWSLLWSRWSFLQLGASYTQAYDLEVNRKVTALGVSERGYSSWTTKVPAMYRAGLQFRLGGRWRVGSDAQFQPYTDSSGLGESNDTMLDEYTLGFGLERDRANVRRGGWNNLPFRFGATIRRWAYEVGGNPIEEKSLNIGTGFAFRGNMGQLDVALSYSLVGDMSTNGMESEVWRLTVSVTGLEKWW